MCNEVQESRAEVSSIQLSQNFNVMLYRSRTALRVYSDWERTIYFTDYVPSCTGFLFATFCGSLSLKVALDYGAQSAITGAAVGCADSGAIKGQCLISEGLKRGHQLCRESIHNRHVVELTWLCPNNDCSALWTSDIRYLTFSKIAPHFTYKSYTMQITRGATAGRKKKDKDDYWQDIKAVFLPFFFAFCFPQKIIAK